MPGSDSDDDDNLYLLHPISLAPRITTNATSHTHAPADYIPYHLEKNDPTGDYPTRRSLT